MYDLIAFCKWRQSLPMAELAEKMKGLGFDGIDLPCRPSAPITHATGPRELPEAQKVCTDHGAPIVRLVTSLEAADDETERLLETVREIGIRKIRIGGYSLAGEHKNTPAREVLALARKRLAALGKLLEKHGVMGAVQNHSGPTLDVNASSCLLMLSDCDPAWVGVQYDPGHCTISGESIDVAVPLLGPYLHSVNLKSPRQVPVVDPETERLTWRNVWVKLRDGMVDVHQLVATLCDAGYTDPISIHAEYRNYFYTVEHDGDATDKLVAEDVAYVRKVMAEVG